MHLEILPASQLVCWEQLQQHPEFLEKYGYFLAGGTALSLQCGHRQSEDFDFFCADATHDDQRLAWCKERGMSIQRVFGGSAHGTWNDVRISLIGGYTFPLLHPMVPAGRINLTSIADIASMKLLAITNRATVRDYIDLAIILRDHCSIDSMLADAKQKYGDVYDEAVYIRALGYFHDVDRSTLPVVFDKALLAQWEAILTRVVDRKIRYG